MFVDGALIFTALALITLSLLYLIFGFVFLNGIKLRKIFKKDSYNGIGALRILSAILIGFALSTVVLGVLFGLMTWVGAKIVEITGLCQLSLFAIILLVEYLVNKSNFFKSGIPGAYCPHPEIPV